MSFRSACISDSVPLYTVTPNQQSAMRIRHGQSTLDKIELQMTPMIDVVFQLNIFFLFSVQDRAAGGRLQHSHAVGRGGPSRWKSANRCRRRW